MFLAFGCNVVLTVWPRSMEVGTGTAAAMMAAKLEEQEVELYTIADLNNTELEGGGGWIAEDANVNGEDETTTTKVDPHSLVGPKKGKVTTKPPRPSFMITLVHGDHVVFYGDDFEVCRSNNPVSFAHWMSSILLNEKELHFVSVVLFGFLGWSLNPSLNSSDVVPPRLVALRRHWILGLFILYLSFILHIVLLDV